VLESLAIAAAIYACFLGFLCLLGALCRRGPGRVLHSAVGVVEIGFVIVAIGEVVLWIPGEQVARPAVHAAYMAVSIVLVPVIAGRSALGIDATARVGDGAALAVALFAAAIVEMRLLATG
jgi:hypothetical protein